jgi:hypothetical protein
MPVRCNNADIAAYGLPFVSVRIANDAHADSALERDFYRNGVFGSGKSERIPLQLPAPCLNDIRGYALMVRIQLCRITERKRDND